MIESITNRHELIVLIGSPLEIEATVTDTGGIPGRSSQTDVMTLLLEHIRADGVQAPISHAWVRLGPTGSQRARKLGRRILRSKLRMTAEIVPYRSGPLSQEMRLGLGEISNVTVEIGGKIKTIARSKEVVDTDRGERFIRAHIDAMLDEMMYREQQSVMQSLRQAAEHSRLDATSQSSIDRYFIRRQPITDGQMRHVTAFLKEQS